MSMLYKISKLCNRIDEAFKKQTSFCIREICISKISDYFYTLKDPSSLAVTRIFFGLAMLFDIPEERGGSIMDKRWGDSKICHFPLIHFIQALPMPYMAFVYAIMWIGALGIMLGYKFRTSATMFAVCYWYLFLIDKSYWNNHSYLFGLVSLLLIGTQANNCFSLDAYFQPSRRERCVPYWNYFVLKYQFFVLYFVAGLKKGTAEWLSGYSLLNLSEHWVFDPFKLFLTVSQIDYLVVHWFAFAFDLTVAFWMMWRPTRHLAMTFCAAFHLMNIRLFRIGMFPWVCLATMPLFYPFDWPKIVYKFFVGEVDKLKNHIVSNTYLKRVYGDKTQNVSGKNDCNSETDKIDDSNSITAYKNDNCQRHNDKIVSESCHRDHNTTINKCYNIQRKITTYIIILYVGIQGFLPYSHFITKGYNNWTNGLYGYSWDMMVHTWDTVSVVIKIVDNERNKEFYLNPEAWAPSDRWTRHGDMVYQYAHCIKRNLLEESNGLDVFQTRQMEKNSLRNISIYTDVWCSMNGRFQQRMFDFNIDLLQANWSLFEQTNWLMPLLVDAEHWRTTLTDVRSDVHTWNNFSDVSFVADFPGYYLENFISDDLTNVSLQVLDGRIGYEPDFTKSPNGKSLFMKTGDQVLVVPGSFHKVHNIGSEPAYYMYTFTNTTHYENRPNKEIKNIGQKLPVGKEFVLRLNNMFKFFSLVVNSLFQMFFRMPMSIITLINY